MPLTTPRFRVLLADGTEHDVQVWNTDFVRFDIARNKQKWPDAEHAPMLWQAYIVWSALRRESMIPGDTPWEVFMNSSPQITPINEDGSTVEGAGTEEEVDPSLAGAELD